MQCLDDEELQGMAGIGTLRPKVRDGFHGNGSCL